MIDYEDLILQRQEAMELYEDGVEDDVIEDLYPDLIDFDDLVIDPED